MAELLKSQKKPNQDKLTALEHKHIGHFFLSKLEGKAKLEKSILS